ncbi:enoyl-CoA hydratase [Oleomonas cavernae]|uniref:Enoyl-CoA hydratase n=1 Tax=Oleomonas cavernae TaxID=2320859 RepID=A0A418VUM8_9PROT|nr:crotonase/enoyl-CoA hydratase family protein [Oleomonas cavernae]RJF80833.1 enoyl-CoA hydratase [Oleomonas cavernae]
MTTLAQFETVTVRLDGHVATIELNRPDKLNAFNAQMRYDITDAFDVTDGNPDVRAVIMTGAGRAYCAGADLSAGGATFDYDNPQSRPRHPRLTDAEIGRDGGGMVTLRIFESLKPVIGAINGPAVGIGVTMTLPMDIRLASTTARFGFVFARRGIVPEAASSWFLPRVVGVSTALEWCYSGRVFPAAEALSRGLVRSVHEPDDLLPAAMAIATEIAEQSAPVSVSLTRQMMWRMLTADHPMEAHKVDSRLVKARGKTADAKEGVMSFIEKRAPNYPDRVPADMPAEFPWWTDRPWE